MRQRWIESFLAVRRETERLAAPLSAEDQLLQAMPDASPTKWHRAHTTWFFETFLVKPHGIAPYNERYEYLFNSYYEAVGPRHPRPKRGSLSRPSMEEITAYRRAVDGRMIELLERLDEAQLVALSPLLALGLAHEEQHQELILTDILAAFAQNPLAPCYLPEPRQAQPQTTPSVMHEYEGGLVQIGAETGFMFDNEGPRHRVFLAPFALSGVPFTVEEVLAFIDAGGYRTASLWLSEGWDWVQRNEINAPGYARRETDGLWIFTLHGPRLAARSDLASHLSYYEADALARFFGGRLPTESEWEHVAARVPVEGQFRESGVLTPQHPAPASGPSGFGGVWEWTSSAYAAYPGYAPDPGALGEYNGKFMIGQQVLRGGSCFSNQAHLRATYRNFWPAPTRFQMTGARLARTIK